jgi:DNA polymerase III subunit delta
VIRRGAYTRRVAELKPVYLVCGDDDAKIDSWRTRLRERAESEAGPGALESFDASSQTPAEVAAALAALTFATGTRYLLVDGTQAWKARELDPLDQALVSFPPQTVLVLIVRGKPLDRLAKTVKTAGGELRAYAVPKPWQMPKWVVERAAGEGLRLDLEAARALVGAVGPSPLRLAREVEKLALMAHPRDRLDAEEVERLAAPEASSQVYDIADALMTGDGARALGLAEALGRLEERTTRLAFPIVRRLREVHRAVALLDSGVPEGDVGTALGQPAWLAKKTVARARNADRDSLERALCAFADLEVDTRGGGVLDEDTAFSLTLARAAAG